MSAPELVLYPRTRWALRLAQIVLGVLTPLLLLSIGGAGIATAPLLLPALWLVGRGSNSVARGYFVVLAALTAGEAVWAATWWTAPKLVLLAPVAIGVTAIVYPMTFGRVREPRHVALTMLLLAALGSIGPASLATDATVTSESEVRRARQIPVERTY
jgi:hypothetical protein